MRGRQRTRDAGQPVSRGARCRSRASSSRARRSLRRSVPSGCGARFQTHAARSLCTRRAGETLLVLPMRREVGPPKATPALCRAQRVPSPSVPRCASSRRCPPGAAALPPPPSTETSWTKARPSALQFVSQLAQLRGPTFPGALFRICSRNREAACKACSPQAIEVLYLVYDIEVVEEETVDIELTTLTYN